MRVHQQHEMERAESVHAGFGIADFDSDEKPRAVVVLTMANSQGEYVAAVDVADAERFAQQITGACAAARGKQVELDA